MTDLSFNFSSPAPVFFSPALQAPATTMPEPPPASFAIPAPPPLPSGYEAEAYISDEFRGPDLGSVDPNLPTGTSRKKPILLADDPTDPTLPVGSPVFAPDVTARLREMVANLHKLDVEIAQRTVEHAEMSKDLRTFIEIHKLFQGVRIPGKVRIQWIPGSSHPVLNKEHLAVELMNHMDADTVNKVLAKAMVQSKRSQPSLRLTDESGTKPKKLRGSGGKVVE